jgi:hypothetical protein
MKAACEACRYWAAETAARGQCRRYAPRTSVGFDRGEANAAIPYWATTESTDWCGDFSDKAPGNGVPAPKVL